MENRPARTTRLYNRILEYEERLERLRIDFVASVCDDDPSRAAWLEARFTLRVIHEELLSADLEFLEKGQLLSALWMRVYYAAVEKGRDLLSKGPKAGVPHDTERAQLEVLGILEEGLGFFILLTYRLRRISGGGCHYQHHLQNSSLFEPSFGADPPLSPLPEASVVSSVLYECLLYQGDLARYRSMFLQSLRQGVSDIAATLIPFGPPPRSEWDLAEGFYWRASKVVPASGHAYNQLAVLNCMNDDFVAGIKYYLRAALSRRAFAKAAGNLLTSCRRVVGIPEERLALSENPVQAAAFGLLLRLASAAIVHDLSRSSQSVHLEGIQAALSKLCVLPSDVLLAKLGQREEHTLLHLFVILISAMEFLQRDSAVDDADGEDDEDTRHLSPTQLGLVQWLFRFGERLLRRVQLADYTGLRALSVLSLWLTHSNVLRRLKNTKFTGTKASLIPHDINAFLGALADLWNATCQHDDDDADPLHNRVLAEDWNFVGCRAFNVMWSNEGDPRDEDEDEEEEESEDKRARTETLARISRVRRLVDGLVGRGELLVLAEGRCYTKEEHDKQRKREMMGTKLARQRLVSEISQLQGPDEEGLCTATWHIADAEVLLDHWNVIERLMAERTRLRLIILLATLRYLDFAKSDHERMTTSRRIMRFILAQTRDNAQASCIHLQHPEESIEPDLLDVRPSGILLSTLPRHHKALLSAAAYYGDPTCGYSPLVILCSDVRLCPVFEGLAVDCVGGSDNLHAYFESLDAK